MTLFPTATGDGLADELVGLQTVPAVLGQTRDKPTVLDPILLMKASLAPESVAWTGVTGGWPEDAEAGKFGDAVSPPT